MKRTVLVLLVPLLAICAQAQQFKLSDSRFEVTIPSTNRLSIVTTEGNDKVTEYFTGTQGENVFISVRTVTKGVALTQEVADSYMEKAATQDTWKDSEGWVYNVTSRTRGHINGSALTFAKDGKMGNQAVAEYWTYVSEKFVDLDDNSAQFRREWVIVVDAKTILTVTMTTPAGSNDQADWDLFSKSLKVKPGFINIP